MLIFNYSLKYNKTNINLENVKTNKNSLFFIIAFQCLKFFFYENENKKWLDSK